METICVFIVSLFYLHFILNESSKILEEAKQLFMRIGIKSVSMDDIAQVLRISKKTIYKCFKDKQDLVNRVIEEKINFEKSKLDKCASKIIQGISTKKAS